MIDSPDNRGILVPDDHFLSKLLRPYAAFLSSNLGVGPTSISLAVRVAGTDAAICYAQRPIEVGPTEDRQFVVLILGASYQVLSALRAVYLRMERFRAVSGVRLDEYGDQAGDAFWVAGVGRSRALVMPCAWAKGAEFLTDVVESCSRDSMVMQAWQAEADSVRARRYDEKTLEAWLHDGRSLTDRLKSLVGGPKLWRFSRVSLAEFSTVDRYSRWEIAYHGPGPESLVKDMFDFVKPAGLTVQLRQVVSGILGCDVTSVLVVGSKADFGEARRSVATLVETLCNLR